MSVLTAAGRQRTPGALRRPRRPNASVPASLAMLVLAVLFGIPFVWIVLTALKTQGEISLGLGRMLPSAPKWSNLADALTTISFPAYAATPSSWPR